MSNQIELGAALHFYQPEREIKLPSGGLLEVLPEINETIYRQVYYPILVEGDKLPDGVVFSFYTTLREWMKKYHARDFDKVVRKIQQTENAHLKVLGDPFLHVIMPFMEESHQRVLVEAGKLAFEADFGFSPRGFWLPETAVSYSVLESLYSYGYQYVVLKDFQVQGLPTNPVEVDLGRGRSMRVLGCDSRWSGAMAFDEGLLKNGDGFLHSVANEGRDVCFATDGETFGHHKSQGDKFLNYTFREQTMRRLGISPMDIERRVNAGAERVGLNERTSWSCPHSLGRWMGNCNCDNPSSRAIEDKRAFYNGLMEAKTEVNAMLARMGGSNWQTELARSLAENRSRLFGGVQMYNWGNVGRERARVYEMVMTIYIGMTSCGWFFGGDAGVERQLPAGALEELARLRKR